MHAPIHLALSWLVASRLPERRDRVLVTWAGVVPDADAFSYFFGIEAYSEYHHVLTHGILAAAVVSVAFALFGRQRLKVLWLSLATFHLHLLCDLVGSGAHGEPWSIAYLWPFSRREIIAPYSWDLASPQNAFVWLGAIAFTIWIALRYGRTFAETFLPARADAAVVRTLRQIFVRSRATSAS